MNSILQGDQDTDRNILEFPPKGIIITNPKGLITFFNTAGQKILNLAPEELERRNIFDIIPEVWKDFQDLLLGVEHEIERRVEWDDRTIIINQIPIIEQDAVIKVLNLLQDVSCIEQIIRERETCRLMIDEMVAIIESSYDGFFITDGEGNIIRVNPSWEKITGVSAREVLGQNVAELESEGYFSKSVTKMVLKEKRTFTLQKKWFTGKETLVTSTPIFDDKGVITMVVSNVRDLSDIRRLSVKIGGFKGAYSQYRDKIESLKTRHFEKTQIVAEAYKIKEAFELAGRIAQVDAPVLIMGETGAGKEVIANYIHRHSKRASSPLLKINCGAIPENLLEAELFGYERGAFTGANEKGKPGLFEAAEGGTLILDEIGEMPQNLQVKLLGSIQDLEILRIGSVTPKKVDVRLIVITNRDLQGMVEKGTFRKDLYFRINVIPIFIPPLRERPNDILHMINLFLKKINFKYAKNAFFSREVIDCLIGYEWPGNVRELINFIERLVLVTPHNEITMEDIPASLRQDFLHYSIDQVDSFKKAVSQFEIKLLRKAIEKHGGVRQAAHQLKMDPTTIYRKLKIAEMPL
jgi:PAS domain S-box-containing protein